MPAECDGDGRTRPAAQLLGLDAPQGFIGCQLQLFEFTCVEIPNLGLQRGLGDRSQLECQSYGVARRPGRGGADQSGSGQAGSSEIGCERNNEDGLKSARQRITLPDNHGPVSSLFPRPVGAEVSPPDLTALQLRSIASSDSAHSARPCSASGRSSAAESFASLVRFQRLGSGRLMTIRVTLSPGRRPSGPASRSTPLSYWASTNLTTFIVSRGDWREAVMRS